ncbi:MAG: hypothetical protein ACD_16C00192G0001 [uncultured bacterium]|nr:MAG: hypothetical protein ACD_16C00192G0001 [uncultured bacterium]OFW68158.1 MAG: hypothetical protein A2X70_05615 [Alphaproteobacteria bacterium GWC2_42_16]OFW73551.1 MAG: hypothetical protein A2Z80_06915 [Alphaproteobacteria bacterium GWA2_41_27]OFW82400.1 MAG: hypothetical protein A3E50_04315 [Alphaproteobacteria bacterium RIFCSPHIGHO2_12_FULL_42_100]OFW86225.1 MAG: hypothetical protein A2W06_01245 [Alphaproteobacteria bacterium RBG_16_42_14]OFW91784.1 MAG: hypothetical protein A3C41_012
MFKKVLIANRGEVACRIIRTLRQMGIKTLAVYSEADEEALHVKMADEAFFLGPNPARESYLNGEVILKIAKKSGAEAIHPGYGFLSENPTFAAAVEKEGLVFIGPSARAIASMGDKLKAKRLAHSAGVSCLPGGDVSITNQHMAKKIADEIGYPIMIKAAAGGGGRGMRIVRNSHSLPHALKSAINEATSSFNDGRVFIEKYIENARHIEIQILGDIFGNTIHLGERECSLQRRHQKVIEEAPSPFLTPKIRKKMAEEALRLAKEVQYYSAGTVEFVVSPDKSFYFLEMNTRLQVEHPTTELITGLDLVEEMIRIAAGEPLRYQQKDIQFKGHAMEARLYAEDSSRGFLPSIGRLSSYEEPFACLNEIRVDSGVREGDAISPYYDPLFAKLCVHQPTRKQCASKLLDSLNQFYVRGVFTNASFLSALVHSPLFAKADFNTSTIDELYPKGFTPSASPDPLIPLGIAAIIHCIKYQFQEGKLALLMERKPYFLNVSRETRDYKVRLGKKILKVNTNWRPGDSIFECTLNGHKLSLQLDPKGTYFELSWNGYKASPLVVTPRVAELIEIMHVPQFSETIRILRAPMPGLVIDVFVKKGEPIKTGQPIVAIEAMKMENVIQAACDGIIESISVKRGESVTLDQEIAKID